MSTDPAKANKRLADLAIMRTLIHSKDFAIERDLMTTKWFEYRFMSPLEATEVFRAKYVEGLQRHVRANVDLELATKVRGVRSGLPTKRERWFSQLWHARQRADSMCVPYELVIAFGFDFSTRRKRHWNPLPHQLFASEANGDAWRPMFESYVEDHLPLCMARLDDPRYHLEHDRGLLPQRQLRDIMREELRSGTSSWVRQVATIWYERRNLSLQDCLDVIPADSRKDVRAGLRVECEDELRQPSPSVELVEEDFELGCFGVREAIDINCGVCSECPLKAKCEEAAKAVAETMMKRTGSTTPVRDAERERIRRNVANHRARKAEKGVASEHASSPGFHIQEGRDEFPGRSM